MRRKKSSIKLKWACLLTTSVSCALLSATTAGCNHANNHVKTRPKLSVTHPLKQQALIVRDYVCQVRSIQHIELRALERGYLQHVHVDEGQRVKAGQLMFEIMPQFYQAEFEKAQAEEQFKDIEYRNTERLANNKVVAPSELALAKAGLDKAKAKLAFARVRLDFTQIKAPFDGIMGSLLVRQGSLLEDGELLTTLSDNSQMWVYFNVPEAEYLQYGKQGMHNTRTSVKLIMADNSTYQHSGEVTTIEADFNNKTGNIAYRATFPNPEGLLRHGQTGKILVELPINDALVVPQKAVFEILDKRFVLVVDPTGKVSSKEIKISAQMPDIFVISDGLTNQDQILLEGQRKVNEGDYVEPKFQDPATVMKNLKVYAE